MGRKRQAPPANETLPPADETGEGLFVASAPDNAASEANSKAKANTKERLDQLLVDCGLAESRTRAQAMVMAGLVLVDGQKVDKPGTRIARDKPLSLKGQDHPWVSRGGLKLVKGIETFALDPTGLVCLDVGASTGGFTDVLCQHGAARVYAVDVGYGQLAHRLRTDPRVVVLERCNARHLTDAQIPEPVDLVVCDASFIGLRTVLETPLTFLRPGGALVALIKPQFEVGKERVGKGGVVRDPALHHEVCETIRFWLESRPGWTVLGLTESPIKGPEGNIEFLIAGRFSGGADSEGSSQDMNSEGSSQSMNSEEASQSMKGTDDDRSGTENDVSTTGGGGSAR